MTGETSTGHLRCDALTRGGSRCRGPAVMRLEGFDYCRTHGERRRALFEKEQRRKSCVTKAMFIERLEDGCSGCEFDEAEGGLVNHCDTCCRWLTTQAYELFVIRMEWPEGYDAHRAVKAMKADLQKTGEH